MSATIRCVLFDLDGVLADYDRDRRIGTIARQLGHSPQAVRAAIYESGIEDAADAGLLDSPSYLSALGRELDRQLGADLWVAARRTATRIRQPMLELADELGERGVRLAVLSNNGTLMSERWPAIVPALVPLFEGRFFCSGALGAAKPSPVAYRRCLAALAVPPEAALFVDDCPANVAGARGAALTAQHFVDLPQLRQALASCGLT